MNESNEDKLSKLFPLGYVIVYIQGVDVRIDKFNPNGLEVFDKFENKLLA